MLTGIPLVLGAMVGIQLLVARLLGRSLFRAPSVFEASLGRKVAVLASGPAAVYVLCAGLFFGFAVMNGEQVVTLVVDPVPGLPAEAAGVEPGDRVVSVSGRTIDDWEQVPAEVKARGSEPVEIVIERGGRQTTLSVMPRNGVIGIRPRTLRQNASLVRASARAFSLPFVIVATVFRALTGSIEAELSGPVAVMRSASGAGMRGALFYVLGSAASLALPFAMVLDLGLFGALWLARRRGKS